MSEHDGLPEAEPELQVFGESLTFDECDEMLACITAILDAHLLNGATHAHGIRWKLRQLRREVEGHA
jgi:hypothetical protein